MTDVWHRIETEARGAYHGEGRFPLRAYSELMPPPYVGVKPYAGLCARRDATCGVTDRDAFDIDEYELAHDLEPGWTRIAEVIVAEIGKLTRGDRHTLSHTLLADNPAWPAELADAARAKKLAHDPIVVMCALALSRSQDDKGNARWTLFGTSHDGPAKACFFGLDEQALALRLAWAGLDGDWRIFAPVVGDVPEALRGRVLGDRSVDGLRTIVTFTPFERLPAPIRAGYLAGTLALAPSPAMLALFNHRGYAALANELPRATQIPLLHLFPRVEGSCAIRIPQSGWLDEEDAGSHGHKIVSHIARTHRWQRIPRDEPGHGDGAYTDKVSVALFSTTPVDIDLYNKPLARNSQIWTADYHALLDGPNATREALLRAAAAVDAGGRFGYRMYYPPMIAGTREVFWHVPVIACAAAGRLVVAAGGYMTAEQTGEPAIICRPCVLSRPDHVAAARNFPKDPGRARFTTSQNIRKLLEARENLGGPIAPAHARALLHVRKDLTLSEWLAELPAQAHDRVAGVQLAMALRDGIAPADDPGAPIVIDQLGTREIEEQIWSSIAGLAHGQFKQKNDGDGIAVNRGKHGGPAAKAARIHVHERRDLEALGDHLHERYRALIAAHGMTGAAEVVDHIFTWETDFDFSWMEGWAKNQVAPAERNIVLVIPGKNRTQAVVMGDHYDTAYMEDVYYAETGGDLLRAPACGADDNHSATTALLLAAERLLPLARAGKLERDVWLVHLTGEEYPGDCMGARALCRGLVERTLAFTREDGSRRDVSGVDVVAAFVLDMVGHNTERDRDVFMIAPGEGVGSAKLARRAHHANVRWNALAATWNKHPDRRGLHRAARVPDGHAPSPPPPPFRHLEVHGEVRVEWEPRSALFNTDGQIFSDVGIPAVLFMENYDISRKGYHDTHDTMANIDLDYCAAVTAIAIETVCDTACAPDNDL